jgi:membrane-associated phospholipid phosphatase
MNWKSFLHNKSLRLEFIFSIILLTAVLHLFSKFLQFIENRNGVILSDPVLNAFNPINLTWFTFGLIYFSVITALILLSREPERLMFLIECYTLLVVFRTIAMYITQLEAPATLIPLDDPLVQLFGNIEILRNDLFFSGHTATMFLLFLIIENKILKRVFLLFTMLVGISVILQHVHYTIDVFAAPFFSFASFKIISAVRKNR